MNTMLQSVSEHLLAPGNLTFDSLGSVLGEVAGPGIDAADLYFQSQVSETWVLELGILLQCIISACYITKAMACPKITSWPWNGIKLLQMLGILVQ